LVYRFGDFTLDLDTRQLSLDRGEVHLSPKAFALLAFLLENRSRAVSKADLQQHLWPSTFVEETNLASLVAEIRRVLGDSPSAPTFVRTVYGFGYRFVGEVVAEAIARPRAGTLPARLCLEWSGRDLMLMEGPNDIGRDADATIHIEARGVSRHHARIVVADGTATLEDLGSKNGTYVNGQRIAGPVALSDRDAIGLGTASLTFRVVPFASPTETVGTEG
jgi:DNA-binding winged helix-turn-helix (wHTH) protein